MFDGLRRNPQLLVISDDFWWHQSKIHNDSQLRCDLDIVFFYEMNKNLVVDMEKERRQRKSDSTRFVFLFFNFRCSTDELGGIEQHAQGGMKVIEADLFAW